MSFFLNALGRTVANEITDSCKPPKCCTVVVECLYSSFSLRYNWCTWICDSAYVLNALPVIQSLVVGFDAVIFCKSQWSPFRKQSTNTQLESVHEYTSTQTTSHYFCIFFVNICCNLRIIYYPTTPILNPPHTPKKDKSKVESQIIIHA